jgi:hypothetical protein
MKHFKTRIQPKSRMPQVGGRVHAFQMWLDAPNIVDAAKIVEEKANILGFDTDDVHSIVEVNFSDSDLR